MQTKESSSQTGLGMDSEAAADRAVWLCELFRNDHDARRGLIGEYLQESRLLIGKLRLAVGRGELVAVRDAASTLRSSALLFGEMTLWRACSALANAPATASRESMDALLSALLCAHEHSRSLLTANIQNPSAP